MSTQPEALRLADVLEHFYMNIGKFDSHGAANELRRLHKANQAMQNSIVFIASIAHFGGLSGKSEHDALVAIRKESSSYLDRKMSDETHRKIIAKGEQK